LYPAEAGDSSAAYGINNQGEVVGVLNSSGASRPFRALRLGMLEPLALPPEHTGGAALSINEKGDAAGHASGAGGVQAVWWSRNGDVYLLASLAGTALHRALGINDSGDVVGVAGDGQKEAVLWPKKGPPMRIGTLPGFFGSEATNVNNRGEIVGYAIGHGSSPMRTRAVLWAPGGKAIQDLGALSGGDDSRARDINSSGVVVGTSSVPHGNRAFVWTQADGLVDLNTLIDISGLVLTDAVSVNERGDIVALGYEVSAGAGGGHHEHAHEDHELPRHVVVLTRRP
jgi:probable HAF family extracellular repeat protein